MLVTVTTVSGSITGTTLSVTVDPKLSVNDFKLLVQDMAVIPREERGPSTRMSEKGITSEYSRVFLDSHELVNDDNILESCGAKEGSAISFAVGKTLAKKLRRAMLRIGEDFSEFDDSEILAAVLQDLKERMHGRGNDQKGAELLDGLYDIFDTDFRDFEGVHDGCLTPFNADGENGDYIQWKVEEKVEAAFPFKTYFGIPVYTHLYGRMEQSIVGQPHPRSLIAGPEIASTGFFGGPAGQQMACTAHFAGAEGTAVLLDDGDPQVGRTVHSNGLDDFAVVAMDVPCTRTGQVTTNRPFIDHVVTRPATFQTAAIPNARITEVQPTKLVVQERGPASSQPGDSNAPWNTPGGRTIGVHRSGGPGGDMSVVRVDIPQMRAAMEPRRRSKRLAGEGPEKKKQKTNATA
jgi:hypothetical protein